MKIAFVSQPWNRIKPPVESGSIAIWTYQVGLRLAAASHDVTVYALGTRRLAGGTRQHEGVTYRYIPALVDRWLDRAHEKLYAALHRTRAPRFATLGYHVGYALAIALDLRRRRPDVVHIPNLIPFVSVIRALNPRVKIVLHMYSYWLTQLDPALVRQRLRDVDLVLGCSESVTDPVREAFPEVADRCATVYNGFNEEYFTRSRAEALAQDKEEDTVEPDRAAAPRLLYVGRVSPEKGIHVLLEAFQEVARRYPDVRLDVVGPNEGAAPIEFIVGLSQEPEVQALAEFYEGDYFAALKALPLSDAWERVAFTGALPYSALAEAYGRADVLINASLSDTFPLPIMEGMGCGLPVVATDAGGAVEAVVDGETGLIVPSGDPAALADAISRLLDDAPLRHRMGEAGQERAHLFSWEKITEALLAQYAKLKRRA